LYGTTIDDAAGEAFDKTAKLLGLPYPGGPRIEVLAREGNPSRYALPRPMKGREGADFSFSGLKTAVRQVTLGGPVDTADLAASFQAAVVDILLDRGKAAMAMFRRDFPHAEVPTFVVAGGVAANSAIRAALAALASREGFGFAVPPIPLCTDNAAMIAWAGIERAALNKFDPLDAPAKARWPLYAAEVL
ncbi:MAG: tRNA (adenosine(37)-N6)-threonylcarbamoyltransferase complex transferase subunit TsaD, partial [Rhizomicrobium sp.]|nr:tRNA (adenosine(37)-N6)-threonylcarbamoyltransferase complex transferase subunit TsaD [Rhizomicrobium sp.]